MRSLSLILSSFLFPVMFASAQPAIPKDEAREKIKDIQETGGALKIEDKPAVPPEALKEEPASVGQTADPAPRNQDGRSHYFGLNAAVGLPHPVSFGLDYAHGSGWFSAGVSTGSTSLTVSNVSASMKHTDLALRVHPFTGAFYLGVLLGQQTISAKETRSIQNADVTAEVDIKSSYTTPHLGWMWGIADGGFFVSLDFGFQSPSGVSTSFSSNAPAALVNTQEYKDLEKEVKDQGNKLGEIGLPHMTLLKLGWLF